MINSWGWGRQHNAGNYIPQADFPSGTGSFCLCHRFFPLKSQIPPVLWVAPETLRKIWMIIWSTSHCYGVKSGSELYIIGQPPIVGMKHHFWLGSKFTTNSSPCPCWKVMKNTSQKVLAHKKVHAWLKKKTIETFFFRKRPYRLKHGDFRGEPCLTFNSIKMIPLWILLEPSHG